MVGGPAEVPAAAAATAVLLLLVMVVAAAMGPQGVQSAWRVNSRWVANCSAGDDAFEPNPGTLATDAAAAAAESAAAVARLRVLVEPAEPTVGQWAAAALGPWVEAPVFGSVLTQDPGWAPLHSSLYMPLGSVGNGSVASTAVLSGLFLCQTPGVPGQAQETDAFVIGVRASAAFDLAPGQTAGTGLVRTLIQAQTRFAQQEGWHTLTVDRIVPSVDTTTGAVTNVTLQRVANTEELAPFHNVWDDRQATTFLADVADTSASVATMNAEPLGNTSWFLVAARFLYPRLRQGNRYDLELGFGNLSTTCGAEGTNAASQAVLQEALVLGDGMMHNATSPNVLAPVQGARIRYVPATPTLIPEGAPGAATGAVYGTLTPCHDALYSLPPAFTGADNITVWTYPVYPRFGEINMGIGDGQLLLQDSTGSWQAAAACPSCEGEQLSVPSGVGPIHATYTMGVKTSLSPLNYILGWSKCDDVADPPVRVLAAPSNVSDWVGGAVQSSRHQLCGETLTFDMDLTTLAGALNSSSDGVFVSVDRWALNATVVGTPSLTVDVLNASLGSVLSYPYRSHVVFGTNDVFVPGMWLNHSDARFLRVQLQSQDITADRVPSALWTFNADWPTQPPAADLELSMHVGPAAGWAVTGREEAFFCDENFVVPTGNDTVVTICPGSRTFLMTLDPVPSGMVDSATGYDLNIVVDILDRPDGATPDQIPLDSYVRLPAIASAFEATAPTQFRTSADIQLPSAALAPFSPTLAATAELYVNNPFGAPTRARIRSFPNGCTADLVDGIDNGLTQFSIRRVNLPELYRDPASGLMSRTPRGTYRGLRTCRNGGDFFKLPLHGADIVTVTLHFNGLGPVINPDDGSVFFSVLKIDMKVLDPDNDGILAGSSDTASVSYWGHSFTFNVTDATRPPSDLVYLQIDSFTHAAAYYDLDVSWRKADETIAGDVLLGPGGTPWTLGPPEPLPPPPPPPSPTADDDEASSDDLIPGLPLTALQLILVIAAAAVVLICIVVVIAIISNKQARRKGREDGLPDIDAPGVDPIDSDRAGISRSPSFRGSRPATVVQSRDEMELADLMSVARQLEDVKLEAKIGEGNFGAVWKAKWKGTPIAAKTVENVREIADELAILTKLDHPNVVHFLGVSSTVCPGEEEPRDFMVFELAQDSVLGLMQRQEVSMQKKIQMLRDAGRGVAYINGLGIVHRDLACRNLLYDRDRVLISDFGLSRKYEGDFYKTDSQKSLPVRWSAPEVLKQGEATTASDTFSFATLMWELMEDAATPFAGLSNTEVMRVALAGRVPEHLTQPDGCPDELYAMMQKMWNPTPKERPPMEEVLEVLDAILVAQGGTVSGYESKLPSPGTRSPDPSGYAAVEDLESRIARSGGMATPYLDGSDDHEDEYGAMDESLAASLSASKPTSKRHSVAASTNGSNSRAEPDYGGLESADATFAEPERSSRKPRRSASGDARKKRGRRRGGGHGLSSSGEPSRRHHGRRSRRRGHAKDAPKQEEDAYGLPDDSYGLPTAASSSSSESNNDSSSSSSSTEVAPEEDGYEDMTGAM